MEGTCGTANDWTSRRTCRSARATAATSRRPRTVASISKELFNWTDTYTIDVADPGDALYALMVVLAIDAEKCSRND